MGISEYEIVLDVMCVNKSNKPLLSLFINLRWICSVVIFMGDIRGVITAKTECTFREIAMKKFGYRKGSLSQAMEEALHQWIELNKTNGEIESEEKK